MYMSCKANTIGIHTEFYNSKSNPVKIPCFSKIVGVIKNPMYSGGVH